MFQNINLQHIFTPANFFVALVIFIAFGSLYAFISAKRSIDNGAADSPECDGECTCDAMPADVQPTQPATPNMTPIADAQPATVTATAPQPAPGTTLSADATPAPEQAKTDVE